MWYSVGPFLLGVTIWAIRNVTEELCLSSQDVGRGCDDYAAYLVEGLES